MTHELEKLQRKGTKPTCPHCHATVLSTSQPNLMGTTTDIAQELVQQIPDNNDMITMQMHVSKRAAVLAALAAAPAVGGEIQPHIYSPDYQAMGDCRVCGHAHDKPWHTLPSTPSDPAPSSLAIENEQLRKAIQLHAGDAMSLSRELDDWRERALVAEAALAAPPASPLRGREPDEWELAKFLCEKLALEDFDKMSRTKYLGDAKAVLEFLSASLPKQPAAVKMYKDLLAARDARITELEDRLSKAAFNGR